MPVDFGTEARLAYLRWLANEDSAEQERVRTLRDYVNGVHPVYLTDRQKDFLGLKAKDADHLFSHNLCALVVASVVERLSVTGFAPAEAGQPDQESPLASAAMQWWETNRMDAGADELHEAACRDGEAYIIVSWHAASNMPQWSINQKFDGTQGVKVHADPDTGTPLFASKRWQTSDFGQSGQSGRTRLTLYFPDRVEKYISASDPEAALSDLGWARWTDNEGEPWPIPWTDVAGSPLGLPVIPFTNPGGSEIADLIPLQDMLNKSDLDLVAGADAAGFRVFWASGLKAQIDPSTGEEKTVTVGPGRLLRMGDPQARMGAIDPVDLTRLIEGSQYWIEAAAGVTRTPQYLFQAQGADQPSGESLKMQEVGLLAKTERKQRVFGNAWENVVYLSRKLWNLYRMAEAIEEERLATQWKPAETRNEKEQLEAAQIKAGLGVPEEQIWAELGYDQTQIERFREMQAAQQAQQESVGSFLLRNFDRGQ